MKILKVLTAKVTSKSPRRLKVRYFVQFRIDITGNLQLQFWKTITYSSPVYGIDILGSLFDRGVTWNLNEFDSLLRYNITEIDQSIDSEQRRTQRADSRSNQAIFICWLLESNVQLAQRRFRPIQHQFLTLRKTEVIRTDLSTGKYSFGLGFGTVCPPAKVISSKILSKLIFQNVLQSAQSI